MSRLFCTPFLAPWVAFAPSIVIGRFGFLKAPFSFHLLRGASASHESCPLQVPIAFISRSLGSSILPNGGFKEFMCIRNLHIYICKQNLVGYIFLYICIYIHACTYICTLNTCDSDGKSACNAGDLGLTPAIRKILWRRKWQPAPVFLPGETHGQRSLVGYSPCGHKKSDGTERLRLSLHMCLSTCVFTHADCKERTCLHASRHLVNDKSMVKFRS